MNTRVRTAERGLKATTKPNKLEKMKTEVVDRSKLLDLMNGPKRRMLRREKMIALQQDVDKLKKKLRHEENVHRALERALTRPLGSLPRLPPYLPANILELLAEVAVLEEEVVRLEEQVLNCRRGLYQEAIYISSSQRTTENVKNVEQLKTQSQIANCNASAICKSSPLIRWTSDRNPSLSSSIRFKDGKLLPKKLNSSLDECRRGEENHPYLNSIKNVEQSLVKKTSRMPDFQATDKERVAHCIRGGSNENACEDLSGANKLSEEILRCLLRIFSRIRLPKNIMVVDSRMCASASGSCDTSEGVKFRDPYGICTEFRRRDIGPYKKFCEVDSNSIDASLIQKFSFLTLRLRLLLRKLASVGISELNHQQKLAFWINIYNSCMMNAFLENGFLITPEMVIELMSKAMVNVGGCLFTAMMIEHFILRLPYNSKHTSPKSLKSDEMPRWNKFRLHWPEPLVTFALSCGSWSSPAVRVYTASHVEKQLEEAKRDYLQAAVVISEPNKFAVPKLLDWYLFDFAEDKESLLDWVCLELPNELTNDAIECLKIVRRCGTPHPIQVLPYEFRFRYKIVIGIGNILRVKEVGSVENVVNEANLILYKLNDVSVYSHVLGRERGGTERGAIAVFEVIEVKFIMQT